MAHDKTTWSNGVTDLDGPNMNNLEDTVAKNDFWENAKGLDLMEVIAKLVDGSIISYSKTCQAGYFHLFKDTDDIAYNTATINTTEGKAEFVGEKDLWLDPISFTSIGYVSEVRVAITPVSKSKATVKTTGVATSTVDFSLYDKPIAVGTKFFFPVGGEREVQTVTDISGLKDLTTPSTVVSGTFIRPNGERYFKIGPSGEFVLLYWDDTVDDIVVLRSTDNGDTWTDLSFPMGSLVTEFFAFGAAMGIKANGDIYVATKDSDAGFTAHEIVAFVWDEGTETWGSRQLVDTDATDNNEWVFDIVEDGDGYMHVIWVWDDGTDERIYDSFWNGSTWSSRELINSTAGMDTAGITKGNFDVKKSPNGNLNFAWFNKVSGDTYAHPFYNIFSSGSWGTPVDLENSDIDRNGLALGVMSDNDAVVAWNANDADIVFNYQVTGIWQGAATAKSAVGNFGGYPAFVEDENGDMEFMYNVLDGSDYDYYHVTFFAASGVWGTESEVFTSTLKDFNAPLGITDFESPVAILYGGSIIQLFGKWTVAGAGKQVTLDNVVNVTAGDLITMLDYVVVDGAKAVTLEAEWETDESIIFYVEHSKPWPNNTIIKITGTDTELDRLSFSVG
jgi:hypothetical protein